MQGSVILNAVAAKAVCLLEALQPEFRDYAHAVLANARAMAGALSERGAEVLTGGTDTPLLLVDLRPLGLTGAAASDVLEAAGLTANKNGVPGDTQPPQVTSGLRFGVSAGTARGMGEEDFTLVGNMVADVLYGMASGDAESVVAGTHQAVTEMVEKYPIY